MEFTKYIQQGIRHGFSVGFHEAHISVCPSRRNSPSAYEHPQVADRYLQTECEMGRALGSFVALPADALHISCFGVIPKKSQPGKWRLIVDLSAPEGHSVNDGIPGELCSLRYPSLDTAVHLIVVHGPGVLLSKLDIKDRMVLVHLQSWFLLGMHWNWQYYVNTRLQFGLCSAPKIFTAVANALQWILLQQGLQDLIHYLDNFLICRTA